MKLILAMPVVVLGAAVTPTEKVVQLLEGMKAKAEQEKEAGITAFKEYTRFCRNTAQEKKFAIEDAEKAMDQLKAEISKEQADSERLGQEIEALDGEIAQAEADMQAATELRVKEKADYEAQDADYAESLDALESGIFKLKQRDHDVSQADMFLQKAAQHSKVLASEWSTVRKMLAQVAQAPEGAPQAAAYTSNLAPIIDMFKEMKKKISDEKSDLNKEEANRAHAYELQMMDLTDQVEYDKTQRENKAAARAGANKAAAQAEQELSETTAAHADDVKTLSDLNAECQKETEEFDMRQQTRKEEIAAIGQAIDILSSDSVKGKAEKHLPTLIQSSSLLQLRSSNTKSIKESRLFQFVQEKAHNLKSQTFALLAAQMASQSSAGGDPMAKVKQMISDLIDRLESEAGEEAQHHQWCNKELHDNKVTRDERTSEVEQLTANVEELAASIAKLEKDNQELRDQIKQLGEAMAKATSVREEEHARNTETIADSKEAQAAVQKALEVLHSFYDKAASAGGGYTGQQGSSTGVLGMLEVIASDFARLQSETESSEDDAARDYKKFMLEAGGCGYVNGAEVCGSTAEKTDLVKSKEKLIKKKSSEKAKREKELDDTQSELNEANEVYDKLKPACINPGVSVEERVQQREQEIASLQEALEILEE